MTDEPFTVFIDAQGQITVSGKSAQRRLAAHPGRYRLVPSADDLILLERMEPSPSAAAPDSPQIPAQPPRGVVIAGEIDRIGGLTEIISLIHGNAWSGSLAILAGNTRKTVFFKRGDVITAASNVAVDRIGALLYRHGKISAEFLEQALAKVTQEQRVGQILVESGHLSVHDLYQYVRKQIEEIFYSVLVMREGQYYVQRHGDDEGPPSQLLLPTRELLFEGVRRIDELSYFREKIPTVNVVLSHRPALREDTLPPRIAALLQLIDGRRDLAAIARESHLGEFEATKLVYQLMQEGRIETRSRTPAPTRGAPAFADSPSVGETLDKYNHIYARIQALVAFHGRPDVMSRGLRSFFLSAVEFAPLFIGVKLLSDGRLPREQMLANIAMAPISDKVAFIQRGLNELLFFVLFTAGEAVDRRREGELHQRLNQILTEVMGDGPTEEKS